MAGRGWGKTHVGAMDTLLCALTYEQTMWAVVVPTLSDLKKVAFEGKSGIISFIRTQCPELLGTGLGRGTSGYDKKDHVITLYNGSQIYGFSSESPDRLRGPQFHGAWCDEISSWAYPMETLDMLMFNLRLDLPGTDIGPKIIATTTPKNNEITKHLLRDASGKPRKDTILVRGRTQDNHENLSQEAIDRMEERYAGTRLGRQEMDGELVEDIDGALWTPSLIEKTRIKIEDLPEMKRIVIGVDPATTSGENSDETGIVVAGKGIDDRYYIIADKTDRLTANRWGTLVISLYYKWQAHRVVCETNAGGDLITKVLKDIDPNVPYTGVHASKNKVLRAEPISALYEQGKVSHAGIFKLLEDQMCNYVMGSKNSPDRLDAMVWAMDALSGKGDGVAIMPGIR